MREAGGHWSHVGGIRKNNETGNTDRSRVTYVTLGTDPNAPLDYDPGLELHYPIKNNLRGHGCQL